MAVLEKKETVNTREYSEIEKQILQILDEEIRPAVSQDGGDVVFHGFEDGIVKLEMIGACGTCPSSSLTLQGYIENLEAHFSYVILPQSIPILIVLIY